MKYLILTAAVALSGCATSKPIILPDGSQGHSLECGGTDLDWGDCYAKAGETCGVKGYEILATDSSQTPQGAATQYGAFVSTVIKRSMLIRCKS